MSFGEETLQLVVEGCIAVSYYGRDFPWWWVPGAWDVHLWIVLLIVCRRPSVICFKKKLPFETDEHR